MNRREADAASAQLRKKVVRLCGRPFALIALLLVCNACHHRKQGKDRTQSEATPATSVLSYSCALSPTEGFGDLTATNQATLAEANDRLLIHATGTDAQLDFAVVAKGRCAISLDISSPASTVVALYYQVQNQPYSAEHVLQAPLKTGRNQLLMTINDPLFSGRIRLDPGEVGGDYSLHSLQVFSDAPISIAHVPKPPAALGASFEAWTGPALFVAKWSEGLGQIKALQGVVLVPEATGLMAKALGSDPAILLPEFELNRGESIIKIVIVSPVATTLQLYYRIRDQLDYNEAHVLNAPLQQGENTVYLEVPGRNVSGPLRLDPGAVAGDYLLKQIEVRVNPAAPSPHAPQ